MEERHLRRELVRAARDLYRQGMMAGAAGNLSARLDADRLLVTPSGVAKGRLRPEDLLAVDLSGTVCTGGGRPSSEIAMHLAVYQRFPRAMAVVHTHPPVATALAAAHRPIGVECLPEALHALGAIPCVPYHPPAGQALADAVCAALQEGDGALLLNHGAVTVGPSIEAARRKMEVLEAAAAVTLRSHLLGGGVPLPEEEAARLRGIWHRQRWQGR